MLGIHSAQYKHAVAPLHYFAILAHTAYCCPHLHCLLDLLFVCCLPASFLSLFSFSSTKTLKPKPQFHATNQRFQQTSRLLVACLLPSCKEDSNPKPNPKAGSSNYNEGWAAQLASIVFGKFCVIAKVAMIHKKI
jgi:hypothetical protein